MIGTGSFLKWKRENGNVDSGLAENSGWSLVPIQPFLGRGVAQRSPHPPFVEEGCCSMVRTFYFFLIMRVWSAYHGNMLESDSSNYTGPSWKDNHTKTCWKQNILTHSSSHKPHLRELKAGSECAGTHQSPGQASVPRPPPLHRPAAPSAICYQPELLPLNGLPWDQTTHPVRCNHVSPVLCHQVCCLQQLPRQPCICWWTLLHQKWQGEGVCALTHTNYSVFLSS